MPVLEKLLWPVLAALLYVTFAQEPLLELRDMIGYGRFVAAAGLDGERAEMLLDPVVRSAPHP